MYHTNAIQYAHDFVPIDRTAPDTLCAKENTEGIGNLWASQVHRLRVVCVCTYMCACVEYACVAHVFEREGETE